MEEKRYNIYYVTDKENMFRENVLEEDVKKFLKTLTVAEKSHLRIKQVKKERGVER